MRAHFRLNAELNQFATKLIGAGAPGIKSQLVVENGKHDFYFVADLDTPVGVLFALLVASRPDFYDPSTLEYAEQLLGFCGIATQGAGHD